MTRSAGVLVALVVLPALAAGQSLGEAARKEQDRREKLRKAGVTSRSFTEEDLATTKGRLANDPRQQAAARADGDAARPAGAATTSGRAVNASEGAAADPDGTEKKERYWRSRVAEARARVEDARRRNDGLQLMIQLGQPAHYDANGRQVIYSIHQMKAMADAAAAELAAAEAALENLLEEGRRAGALPGWLR